MRVHRSLARWLLRLVQGEPAVNLPGLLLRTRSRDYLVFGRDSTTSLNRRYNVRAKSPSLAATKVRRWGVDVDGVCSADKES